MIMIIFNMILLMTAEIGCLWFAFAQWSSSALCCLVYCSMWSCNSCKLHLPLTLLCRQLKKSCHNQNSVLSPGVAGRFMLLTFRNCFCQADIEKAQDYHCVLVTLSPSAPACWNVLTRPKYSRMPFSRKVMHSVWGTPCKCVGRKLPQLKLV